MFSLNRSPPEMSVRPDELGDFKTPRVGSSFRSRIDGSTQNTDTSHVLTTGYPGISDRSSYRQPPANFRQLSPDADTTLDPSGLQSNNPVDIQLFGSTRDMDRYHTALSGLESDSTFARTRLSDPVRHSGLSHNMSITDADKLERWGHDLAANGNSYDRHFGQSTFASERHSYDSDHYSTAISAGRGSGYPVDFKSTYRQLAVPSSDSDLNRASAGSGVHRSDNPNLGSQRSFPRCTSTGSVAANYSNVEVLQRAADNIIREKDSIIEWQKRQLESIHTVPLSGNRMDQHASMKIQELQYENASLKAKLTELMAAKKCDKEMFDRKLGATEYELRELKLSIDSKMQLKRESQKSLEDQIKENAKEVTELKTKNKELKERNESLLSEVSSVKRYMQDLPTADENQTNLQTIKKLKEEKQRTDSEMSRLEKKLGDAAKGLQSRDQLVETVQGTCNQLKEEVNQLMKRNAELEAKLLADKDLSLIRQLQTDNEKLKSDCHKAKKLLEARKSQLQQQQMTSTEEVKSWKERVDQESATVEGLQRALDDKEQQLKQTVHSMNELTTQHQRLTERCMLVEDKLQELQQQNNAELARLQRQLMSELTVCVLNLQSLIDVCTQCANNEEPNIAALLGVRQVSSPASSVETGDALPTNAVNAVKYQLGKVKELRLQVDGLRSLISDKFAEEMGRRLTCSQQ